MSQSPAAQPTTDHAPSWFGFDLIELTPARCVLSFTVRADMTNGFGVCHGGVLFTLADTAFAATSNAAGAPSMAVGCSIQYLAPAHIGDMLTAVCEEQHRGQRRGVYDVRITNQAGQVIALFRGESSTVRRAPDIGAVK
ncbi:MAG TPA: hydroxyphenylacetyl-CoA thioesterase PaaI [Vineibacter sp.]|nr:hydroxyphenylacetyl-CoA thioesterase PaaI [Vineibacter sp.]